MRAGELRHRVTIQAPIGVADENRAVDLEQGVPMRIEALPPAFQARESLGGGGLQAQTTYRVSCRYRTDIRHAYVLVEQCCTQRTFQIVTIVPSDRRDALDMTCVTNG